MMQDGKTIHYNEDRANVDLKYVRFLLQLIGDVRDWEESN